MSGIISNISEVVKRMSYPNKSVMTAARIAAESQTIFPIVPSSSPTQMFYVEDTATISTISTFREDSGQGINNYFFFVQSHFCDRA